MKASVATITTAQTGYSDVPSTFQGGVIPQAGDIVTIRPGDTLKVRNHFYCKTISYGEGSVKGVLLITNLSYLHTGQ
ncbi:hypothetical protein LV89_01970 [Arcicella aurantiaca]|uniref:Uncharacterized protein n=2 Tax=Arcicella aurantiaca TaxID=591202 RepID=A0A316ECQ4_9BACT|nr:hypothetical protein LV89_01970 [Arcicella aurantiaca]